VGSYCNFPTWWARVCCFRYHLKLNLWILYTGTRLASTAAATAVGGGPHKAGGCQCCCGRNTASTTCANVEVLRCELAWYKWYFSKFHKDLLFLLPLYMLAAKKFTIWLCMEFLCPVFWLKMFNLSQWRWVRSIWKPNTFSTKWKRWMFIFCPCCVRFK